MPLEGAARARRAPTPARPRCGGSRSRTEARARSDAPPRSPPSSRCSSTSRRSSAVAPEWYIHSRRQRSRRHRRRRQPSKRGCRAAPRPRRPPFRPSLPTSTSDARHRRDRRPPASGGTSRSSSGARRDCARSGGHVRHDGSVAAVAAQPKHRSRLRCRVPAQSRRQRDHRRTCCSVLHGERVGDRSLEAIHPHGGVVRDAHQPH